MLSLADHPAFRSLRQRLDGYISALVDDRLLKAHKRIDHALLADLREFDVISGLAGLGVYLFHRYRDNVLLRDVLSYLVRLTEPLISSGQPVPGWWSGNGPRDEPSVAWPGGHGNFGMAHGIAGPLALLSVTMRSGVHVAGQSEAIARICAAFDQIQTPDGWPGIVSLPAWRGGVCDRRGRERPSWCYGIPGIARAHQFAGMALDDPERRAIGEQALLNCITDERRLALLTDASICHGWAGLVQATWRVAADADTDGLAGHLPSLTALLERHLAERGTPARGGFLEGLAGIRLVQHTVARDASQTVGWDACLLLDGVPMSRTYTP